MNWGMLLNLAKDYGPSIASAAGSMASAKSAGRQQTNQHNTNSDQLRLAAQGQEENAAQNRARLEIDQKQAQRDALNDAYKNAIRSSVAMNMQDSMVGGLPKGVPNISFSGGMRPSAMGAEGKAAAGAMNTAAMHSLLNPDTLTQLGPQQHFSATPMKEAGGLENTLGVIGAVGNGVDQYQARKQDQQNQTLVQRLIAELHKNQQMPAPMTGANDATIGFNGQPVA